MKNLLLVIILLISSMVNAKDNYGTTHAAMTAGVVLATAYALPDYTWVAGAGACGWFVYRELQGQGDLFGYPDGYKGEHSDLDRIMDWVLPCGTALGLTIWETQHGIFYPRPMGDGVGIQYIGRW